MTVPVQPIDALRSTLPPEYTVEDYVGQGTQGAVFRGTFNSQPVALKVFGTNEDPRRLQRELALLEQIDCPNLVKIIATGHITFAGVDTTIVAYEYLPGGDLRQFTTPTGTPLDTTTLLEIGCHITKAVEALWQKRIVHRDIKPANIVTDAPRYVLVDVGLARHLDLSDITAPGGAPGTPGYKSPEQARGRRSLTINSDVFSLGVTLYELAARQHPFNRSQHLISTMSPRPLRGIRSDLPEPFTRLIHQMMALVPVERPASIHSRFIQLLEK